MDQDTAGTRPFHVATPVARRMTRGSMRLTTDWKERERRVAGTPLVQSIRQRHDGQAKEWGALTVGSILVTIPVMIMFIRAQRGLITGLTGGSVKE